MHGYLLCPVPNETADRLYRAARDPKLAIYAPLLKEAAREIERLKRALKAMPGDPLPKDHYGTAKDAEDDAKAMAHHPVSSAEAGVCP